ncbi:MAG TPA: 16S rRNA (cytosine(1402)-N(4))-methyltransferase RsmH [Candidatus Acidoferrales bacterium]|nr:16S rRNA (cytosine(1402)-N(4))-methyltransferase RsmH [Candidatus Acidoferrales bacterium]
MAGEGHIPVLLGPVLEWLDVRPEGTYVDATVGLGGHAVEIARRLGSGRLIGIDRDEAALAIARERLAGLGKRVELVHGDLSSIGEIARRLNIEADGVLADLGVSSMQLDTPERGFSFRGAGPLDMRMDRSPSSGQAADEIVNRWPEEDLANLIYRYGEERDSRRIARAIVRSRPIRDTVHLATVVAGALKRGRQKLHPATKTFLALRIAVNRELEELEQFLDQAPATLTPKGRCIVLSYHSLEDRAVKQAFRRYDKEGVLRVLTKKVIVPSEEEREANPRARSAKMRVAERLAAGGAA